MDLTHKRYSNDDRLVQKAQDLVRETVLSLRATGRREVVLVGERDGLMGIVEQQFSVDEAFNSGGYICTIKDDEATRNSTIQQPGHIYVQRFFKGFS
jgi:hypothetical protein